MQMRHGSSANLNESDFGEVWKHFWQQAAIDVI